MSDENNRCIHGHYVGDWAGPDYMCGLCESGQTVPYTATTYQLWTVSRYGDRPIPFSNMMYSPLKVIEMIIRYGNAGLFDKLDPATTWWVTTDTFQDWWTGPCDVVFCDEPSNWAGRFCDRHVKMVEFH
jgi:hypothetical protein